jgi:hypothetical protein
MLANLQLSIQFNVHTHILSKLKKKEKGGKLSFGYNSKGTLTTNI